MPLAMFEFAVKALEALVHLRWRFSQSAAHLPRGFVHSCYSLLIAEDNIHINFLLVEKPFSVTKRFFS